ncbi:MAG: ammonia-forming cytochrome c nitrite reductase subunit c552 [Betaproteobacteria bacterium]|nr:ammonia-forming cytochrome c nitrite reductase subunit c552 [Betaproteobacteria bacterium]MCC7217525.1 ammonia-forming cytochrome c nitrite reductase subunit c552 [Burkholderiales bacterium]
MRITGRTFAQLVSAAAVALLAAAAGTAFAQAKAAPAKASFNAAACLACHAPVKAFYDSGKHKAVGCNACHDGTADHLADSKKRPATKTDLATCGGCHQNQYKSYATMDFHRTARYEKKQMTGPAPDPAYDLLMTPHGFTKEHNLPRGHTFALLDQYVVDRAFGGRFAPKETWRYLAGAGDFKVWDVVTDLYPNDSDQKVFKPGTAAAANPVCLSCKTQDHILDWAFMGDPVPGAKWSRTSKVVEAARSVNHALNCIFCHDPHAAKPRIVRDALIEAVTRTDFPTLYSQDARKTKVDVKDLGVRGYTRKIGMLERYDGKLQCGQCHVEYNCNPGFDPNTGAAIPMADKRTNYFPFVGPGDILKAYDHIQFRDFRNQFTGAALWKAQHPDVETYYGSKHEKAGVDCAQCHMPRVKDAKTGKFYTSHWQTNPKNYIKETCLQCHGQWDEKQARYVIESMYSHYQGKVRNAEFWLAQLIGKFGPAQLTGVPEDALKAARAKHGEAHANWEWWTAANGASFHNLDLAKESLARSVAASQEGIKILDDAIKAKQAPPPAAPAAPK